MNQLENLLHHPWPVSRQTERRELNAPVEVQHHNQTLTGSFTDISQGGLGFTATAHLSPGDEIQVGFTLPHDSSTLHTTAVIRWTDGTRHGAEFLKPSAELLVSVSRFLTSPQKKAKKLARV